MRPPTPLSISPNDLPTTAWGGGPAQFGPNPARGRTPRCHLYPAARQSSDARGSRLVVRACARYRELPRHTNNGNPAVQRCPIYAQGFFPLGKKRRPSWPAPRWPSSERPKSVSVIRRGGCNDSPSTWSCIYTCTTVLVVVVVVVSTLH